MSEHPDPVAFDCEIYPDFALFVFMDRAKRVIKIHTKTEFSKAQKSKLSGIASRFILMGYNSSNYDVPVLLGALMGYDVKALYRLSHYIIKNDIPGWKVIQDKQLDKIELNHFDLFQSSPGIRTPLKVYGGRLHTPTLQDLPYEPDKPLFLDERVEKLIRYCENDVVITWALYDAIKPRIDLRYEMSRDYEIDLRSKSDPQVAEAVIVKKIMEKRKGSIRKPDMLKYRAFNIKLPAYLEFKTGALQTTLNEYMLETWTVSPSGHPVMPERFKQKTIKINQGEYKLGIGGLHSREKATYIDTGQIVILDVTSYNPYLMVTNKWYPSQIGADFLRVYSSILERRLNAKKAGDKMVSDSLKIVINGTFGKLANRYSKFYSPDIFLQITVTGQLALLMLVEEMEAQGIRVLSANTDGIVLHARGNYDRKIINQIAADWEIRTGLNLEDSTYESIAIQNIGNYFAVDEKGNMMGKGIYNLENTLGTNPQAAIAVIAASDYIAQGTSIHDTIENCTDIRKFIMLRSVTGGAVWNNKYLGKTVRWIYSDRDDAMEIQYKKNGNKVPLTDQCRPVQVLPDTLPDDLDLNAYKVRTLEHLNEVGYL